ncbi:hypothetical protein [Chengkuizengella marina]|uniref:DUF3992 domain-containing protein n=1 Tax=Chengkuizengella marina TaxID=2507566 RepID=A0A6N9Q963_9BACL|nr:hypothetical protein [Chengkuizengella marina]NBI31124.1 hypothetical protein [Chengkuizengella marina]
MSKYYVAPWKRESIKDCKDKEISVSCDCCPVEIDTVSPGFDLACGDSFNIFNSNMGVTIIGEITLEADSECGLNVIVTANEVNTPLEIPPSNDMSTPNILSIAFKCVTNIRVECTGTGNGCIGSADFSIIERCITNGKVLK